MKVFRGLPAPGQRAPCALTIGNFDGVHRGHQALLAHVRDTASHLGLLASVMTFEPHPREFFARQAGTPEKAPSRISNLRDKLQSLSKCGIDQLVIERFNTRLATLSPDDFVREILVEGLQVKWLMVGDDFCFGAKRAGTIATLVEAGQKYGFEVHSMPTVVHNGIRISSSALRDTLKVSDFRGACDLLGYPYMISGRVAHGKKLGRTIGFPTLNLPIHHKRPTVNGIFVVQIHGLGDKPVPGVASMGVRPTVDDSGHVLLETHLLDYSGDCYGKLIRVEFLHKLRDEEKYIDLPTLTAAIRKDVDDARAWFTARGGFAISATDRI